MRSRAFDRAVLWSLSVVLAGTAAWMLWAGEESSSLIATVGAFFLGALALVLPAVEKLLYPQRLPAPDPVAEADELARTVRAQWLAEARVRSLHEPRVVPLSWSASPRGVTDRPEQVYPTTGPGRVSRIALDGRLDHRFEDALRVLADGYGRIPSGRLVVLGEPGAGKTVLAMLLTLGLLGRREAGMNVPVLLSAASWDPVRQSLGGRLVESLAATYYAGRPEIPRLLMDEGMLLPVLDGLDEIPESARREAVKAVNRYVGVDRPVVLTCRTAEYEDVVAGGAPVLLRAPVVEVHPVSVPDATAYLECVDWPAGTDWTPVVNHLRESSRSPLHEALATPLMLSLARMVYGRLGGDPAVLLDASRFDCRHAIEDFLSDRVIDAAYAPERLPSGEPDPDIPASAWQAYEARGWLTFLAHHMHRHGEREFTWWRMSKRVLPPWAVLGGAVAVGMTLTALVVTLATWSGTEDLPSVLVSGGLLGGACTVILTALWFVFPERQPGRLSFTFDGSLGRLRRGFATGSLIAALLGLPVLVTTSLVLWTGDRPVTYYIGFAELIAGSAAVAVSVGLALAAHNWLDAPPPSAVRTPPESLLAQDRRSSVYGAVVAGMVLVLTMLPLLLAGLTAGRLAGQAATGWSGRPGRFDPYAAFDGVMDSSLTVLGGPWSLMAALPLVGVAFTVTVLFSRAYPRFLIALVYLRLRRRLPWQLTDFLTDAHRRGLLRQSGLAYQFRHVRLQEHLVAAPDGPEAPGHATPAERSVSAGGRIRWVRTAGLAAGVGVLLAPYSIAPRAGSSLTLGPFPNKVRALSFSPDGRLLATVDGGSMFRTGDPPSGGQVWTVGGRRLSRLQGAERLAQLEFDDSGKTLFGTLIDSSSVEAYHQSWDPWSGRPSGDPLSAGGRNQITGSGSASVLEAVPGQNQVVVKNLTSGQDLVVLTGLQAGQVTEVRFSPDGRFLVTRRYTGEAQLWALEDGRPLGSPVTGLITALLVDFSPDSSVVALGKQDTDAVVVLNTAEGRLVSTLPIRAGWDDLTFSPDGRTLVSSEAYRDARLWDVSSGRQIGKPLTGTAASSSGDRVECQVAYTRDGRTLATTVGPRAEQLRLWNVADASPVGPALYGHTEAIKDLEFSPDGRTLATGSNDRTVRLWRVEGAGPPQG